MFLRKLLLSLCVGAAALTVPDLSRPARADSDRWEKRWRGDRYWRGGRPWRSYSYYGPRYYDGYYGAPYYSYYRPRYYSRYPSYYAYPGYYYGPRVSGYIGPFGVSVW